MCINYFLIDRCTPYIGTLALYVLYIMGTKVQYTYLLRISVYSYDSHRNNDRRRKIIVFPCDRMTMKMKPNKKLINNIENIIINLNSKRPCRFLDLTTHYTRLLFYQQFVRSTILQYSLLVRQVGMMGLLQYPGLNEFLHHPTNNYS